MTSTPRAITSEELRDEFMAACRNLPKYWATVELDGDLGTVEARISGALHSLLVVIDGLAGGLPAFDLVAAPHPDDKAYCIAEGENWIEPGTVLNHDDMLHELLYSET
ncbi:MAG TPA: hypothetical protein VFQ44_02095 [Streptosporangiaceae bacterium]|nr:hypothetical protein [Streptosporangiaceae bacterium]